MERKGKMSEMTRAARVAELKNLISGNKYMPDGRLVAAAFYKKACLPAQEQISDRLEACCRANLINGGSLTRNGVEDCGNSQVVRSAGCSCLAGSAI